jgi:hypothetical protein
MYKRRVITLLVFSLFVVVSTYSSGKPAPKPQVDGPYARMSCESWTRLKIRCTTVTFGAYAPHTVRWYVNGVFYSEVGNLYPNPFASTSVIFACSPSQPSAYSAVAINSLGGVTYAERVDGGARCLTGNP